MPGDGPAARRDEPGLIDRRRSRGHACANSTPAALPGGGAAGERRQRSRGHRGHRRAGIAGLAAGRGSGPATSPGPRHERGRNWPRQRHRTTPASRSATDQKHRRQRARGAARHRSSHPTTVGMSKDSPARRDNRPCARPRPRGCPEVTARRWAGRPSAASRPGRGRRPGSRRRRRPSRAR